ncbi:hypothetical protein AMATHDRAFT_2499 [Amanita thiersii Skay4041]|uniref:non-specific serine/threonine protein kinase n=1 Tax=Amanita thiersii Skay4041 TaxID=703135 RepID=A0A2A9NW81_9AGAR|nr:hypothetical protein AMATHDRAFT_2499 [Amanita thiersii Skay4041]
MLQLDPPSASRNDSYLPSLVDLSRNASVISTSSSDSAPSSLISTPYHRPLRTFSAPRSKSPHPSSSRHAKPPTYLARELGYSDDAVPSPPSSNTNAKPRSKSRARDATPDDFKFGPTLGSGSYSEARYNLPSSLPTCSSSDLLALHLNRKNKMQTAFAERKALAALGAGHPGVVRLYYAFQDEWRLYFVLDLARNGEMQTLISQMGSLSVNCARYYTAQIVDALEYMHSKGVIHRDLKPENVLLDDMYHIKITDFGTGKILESDMEKAETWVGTAHSDFWALGCIIYQMIAGRFAFQGLSDYLTWQKIKRLEYTFPDGFDEQAKDLIGRLLVKNPHDRLGVGKAGSDTDMQALRSHPFLSAVNWDTIWTDPAPKLESGLVRRETSSENGNSHWQDVGVAWDRLVDGEEQDDIEWALDGNGPAYEVHSRKATTGEPLIDIGPLGEVRRQPLSRQDTASTIQPSGVPRMSPVEISLHERTVANFPNTLQEPTRTKSSSSERSQNKVTPKMHTLPLESQQTSKSIIAQEDDRGRNTSLTPVQGNGPASDINFALILKLPEGERILFNSTVEARSMRRRASRLLSLPVPGSKPKTRQLILTDRRLICLKQRNSNNAQSMVSIKSELALRASEKLKERDKEKESRGIIASVERKGEREFMVLTVSKTYSYAAKDANMVSAWTESINKALESNKRQGTRART